ncbi:hypothetical protein K1T71_007232 [Dendrolimus kikuchii]|uniref:Uncharacterized protein n=1 Tax=Dendrolimus kikuchii TaxID=765133 RepID=A0ACC1D0X4_9NEOP|nr:hypothetical protein K1T71_007232 [Dendrolimus kikuchii]
MFPTVDTEDITQVTSLNEKPTAASHARQNNDNSQVATPQTNRELTLNMLIKEIVFCIALALTTYGALHNTPTKISKHPQAIRFFKSESVVIDWYKGQLSSALAFINLADVSFVMYYAPWDAESQYVRGEFEKAANILYNRVHFSAINCWNPGSECRLQHNKIPSWPILMAYTVTSRGVLYKGPRNAHNMVNFLELIMRPLKRVASTQDLVNLLSVCDAVAVGYTPISETSKYYNTWYNVALKSKEFDTIGEICFGVVTSEELAIDLGVGILPNARLMLWNDTKEFITEDNELNTWNESSLMHWVLGSFYQPVARIIPMWKKSFSFERYVDGNPILMLFTPMNPLYEQLPSYALLREVAMEYYNCKTNDTGQWITELIRLQQIQRLLYQEKDFMKFCQGFKFKKPISKQSVKYRKGIESRNNKYPWNITAQRLQKNSDFNFLLKKGFDLTKVFESPDESHLLSSLNFIQECGRELPAERGYYDQCQSFDENFANEEESHEFRDIETTMLPLEGDHLSPENLVQDNLKHFCKLMKFANEWGPPVHPADMPRDQNITHITGLACAKNFSLYMIAVDSVRNHHFAEALGIDISTKHDMTAVVILDSKHESQYVLSEKYSAKSLRDFIYNYTYKHLKRSLRTHVGEAEHTHYFGSDGTQSTGVNNTVRIIDLTTRSFRRIVNTPGTLTLVAVCGGACGATPSAALVGAARLLRRCGVDARATRLDALRHDLPWQYTVHKYPAIFVFPADSDVTDSRAYPSAERISAGGVVALALRTLSAPHHVRVRLALCANSKTNIEKKTCLRDVREHITTVIGRSLKYWRRTQNNELKKALLKRLQLLNQVWLNLGLLHTTDLKEDNKKQKSLLKSLHALSKSWDIDTSFLKSNSSLSNVNS